MKTKTRHLGWLIVPLVLATVLLGIPTFFHARQTNAIQKIERFGGRVLTTHGEPDWLRRLTGNRAFSIYEKATLVNLSETKFADSDWISLERLNGLERLNLSQTQITDAGLVHWEHLASLKALDLSGTRISDSGLEHLGNLAALEYLYLSDTRISDGGLPHLKGLTKLRHLDVTGTAVSREGVEEIQRHLPGVEVDW